MESHWRQVNQEVEERVQVAMQTRNDKGQRANKPECFLPASLMEAVI